MYEKYLASMAAELTAQRDRVRDLIGSRHWLTDGHHKEAILLNLLERHLPSGMLANRGFVAQPDDDEVSREQDILIVDTFYERPLFTAPGLVIALPRTVVGTISVKTRLHTTELSDAMSTVASVRSIAPSAWAGAFFFSSSLAPGRVAATVSTSDSAHAASLQTLSPIDWVAESAGHAWHVRPGDDHSPAMVLTYECGDLSSALFLAALLRHCAAWRDSDAEMAALLDTPSIRLLQDASCKCDFDQPQKKRKKKKKKRKKKRKTPAATQAPPTKPSSV